MMKPKQADARWIPSLAFAKASAYLCAITGADAAIVAGPTRGSWLAENTRHSIAFFLIERQGYMPTKLAAAMPGRTKSGTRHWSTLINSRTRGYYHNEDLEIRDLMDWLCDHWREPLARHAVQIAKARRAFEMTLQSTQTIRAGRLSADDFIGALMAASAAAGFRGRIEAPAERRTSVPEIDAPEAMQMLRLAPVFREFNTDMRCEPAPGGGWFIRFLGEKRKSVTDALAAAARLLLVEARFPGEQRGVTFTGERWIAGLKIAPALAALLTFIHADSGARILQPIDGAPAPAQSPTLAIA